MTSPLRSPAFSAGLSLTTSVTPTPCASCKPYWLKLSLVISSVYTPKKPSPSKNIENVPNGSVGGTAGVGGAGCCPSAMPAVNTRETERFKTYFSVIRIQSSGKILVVTRGRDMFSSKKNRELTRTERPVNLPAVAQFDRNFPFGLR